MRLLIHILMALFLVGIYVTFEFLVRDFSDEGSSIYWMCHKIKDFLFPCFILYTLHSNNEKYKDTLSIVWLSVAGVYLLRIICQIATDMKGDGINTGVLGTILICISLIGLMLVYYKENK